MSKESESGKPASDRPSDMLTFEPIDKDLMIEKLAEESGLSPERVRRALEAKAEKNGRGVKTD
jgi:hypothetical protein